MELIRDFLNVLEEIRTPLIFWSFCGVLLLAAFYFFIEKSKHFTTLYSKIIGKLSRGNLYRTVKLIIICLFTFFILLAILAFTAPLLNTYLDKMREVQGGIQNIQEGIDVLGQEIKKDKKYDEIIFLFAQKKYQEAEELVFETFVVEKDNLTRDELQGYIVASYIAKGQYEEAIAEVIKRDSQRKKWDYSLLEDMVLCFRYYSRNRSKLEAIDLVDKINKIYDCKLVSHLWAVVPTPIIRQMLNGEIVSPVYGEMKDDIQYVLNSKHPAKYVSSC